MNFPLPLHLRTLRKLAVIIALVIGPLLAGQTGHAQSVATATLTSAGANSITIDSNGSFTLVLGVTTNFISGGYTVFYQSNNGSGLFQITGRTSLDPLYPFPFPDPIPFPVLMNPTTTFDFGSGGNGPISHPAGTFNLQSIDIQALNAPIGKYTIFLDNRSIMTDRTGGGFFDVPMGGPTGPVFTVNVVPEPTTVSLLALAGAFVSSVAWRKRRRALSR